MGAEQGDKLRRRPRRVAADDSSRDHDDDARQAGCAGARVQEGQQGVRQGTGHGAEATGGAAG